MTARAERATKRAVDFALGFLNRHIPSMDEMVDDRGYMRFEVRSRAWWSGLRFRGALNDLTEFWECDQCDAMGNPRRIWQPLLWRHELAHTDEEWAAAGYDKAGTLAGPKTDGSGLEQASERSVKKEEAR